MSLSWPRDPYPVCRALLGLHLGVHFLGALPWAAEIWSREGFLPFALPMWQAAGFPGLLQWWDTPTAAALVAGAGLVGAVALASGVAVRAGALLAYYAWTSTYLRNPLAADPSLAFVSLLLLACVLVPPRARELPRPVLAALWIVMAAAYSYSGVTKLASASWVDGSAVLRLLDSPLVYDGVPRALLAGLPTPLLALATWSALGLEILFAPLALWRRARPLLWLGMVGFHVSLVVLVDFAPLSLGMLLLHAFTLDPGWLPTRWTDGGHGEGASASIACGPS